MRNLYGDVSVIESASAWSGEDSILQIDVLRLQSMEVLRRQSLEEDATEEEFVSGISGCVIGHAVVSIEDDLVVDDLVDNAGSVCL